MISLRIMRQDEFPAYRSYFVEDYSREIAENYGHSVELAINLAEAELQSSFPDGPDSKGHELLCLEARVNGATKVVGYLWHSVQADLSSTFIYDFYVFDKYRGQGFGKQAIHALENQLKAAEIHEIKLRVAYYNKRALKLYEQAGFLITGFNMSKKLG
ncbi:GNAT family N-acetyltransferase [Reinekea marinisedimentorum]|uniref:RimJ/RimL family protein N-acetyltransferase n=1 Tax=Reinekea marinisedimentorum TaxID=230495 RepID=A0A4R3HVZ4_9GAMM|nr:GNAT family N-acetyltransferase [Reinekea marinisedimentorum]TCS35529.1 RimJ/RimL family protein N-acetyltransferase [Reinekea marinisedimentorum]